MLDYFSIFQLPRPFLVLILYQTAMNTRATSVLTKPSGNGERVTVENFVNFVDLTFDHLCNGLFGFKSHSVAVKAHSYIASRLLQALRDIGIRLSVRSSVSPSVNICDHTSADPSIQICNSETF